MRIDCHTHTAKYSSCSRLGPRELCDWALQRGLQGLVLSEHRLQWRKDELDELQRRFPDLKLYSGMEVSLREGYDVVLLAGETILDLPPFPDVDSLARALKPHGDTIFSFVAHPFRYRSFMTPELQEVLEIVEGIEMNSINILKQAVVKDNGYYMPENHALYRKTQQTYELAPVYNSDTHARDSVATIANELPGACCPPGTRELGTLLREGAAREWQNTRQIETFLDNYLDF